MNLGIIIETNEAEKAWNAMRLANTARRKNHEVRVFLMGEGVEIESLKVAQYDVHEQILQFLHQDGEMLACGTCLKSRQMDPSQACPLSTMNDCLAMIEWADKVITF